MIAITAAKAVILWASFCDLVAVVKQIVISSIAVIQIIF